MAGFFIFLRSRFSKKRLTDDLRSEVDRLIVDLGREADRDVALLESRIQNLKSLIDEADRRILLSERESVKRLEGVKVLASMQVPETPVQNRAVPEIERTPASNPITVYTRPIVRRSENQIKPVEPLHEKVLDMARKGISDEMIANALSVSLGEVELILDMNNSSL